MEKVIKQLVNKGKIEDRVGEVWELHQLTLFNGEIYEEYKLQDIIDGFKIYVTAEQREIADLKALVELMTEEMAKLRAVKASHKVMAYNALSKGEIKEIEDIMLKHPGITSTELMKTYATSQAVVSRIRRAKHPRSSESYKAYRMKIDLGATV